MAITRPNGEKGPNFKNYRVEKSVKNRLNGVSSDRWAKILWDHSRDWAEWLRQDPLVDGDRWQPVRPLGRGGFGRVGLWNSADAEGKITDEIVIKEQRCYDYLDVGPEKPGLTREAVLQFQLNEKAANVPLLRNFKYLHDVTAERRKNRLYLEFCRNGDLDRLKLRYFAWGTYMPELFLWHVFKSLAEVVVSMSQDRWHDYNTDRDFPDGWNMLHLDLKPENVLVVDDSENPRNIIGSGTSDFLAPEQRHYSIHWKKPFGYREKPYLPEVDSEDEVIRPVQPALYARGNNRALPRIECRARNPRATRLADVAAEEAGLKIDQSVNIWGIGKVMFDMMTLRESTMLDTEMDKITEKVYYDSKDTQQMPDIRSLLPADTYSDRLLDVICSCLSFNKDDRPDPDDLLKEVKAGLKECGSRSNDGKSKDQRRLFFQGTEINDMPAGDKVLGQYLWNYYSWLVDSTYFDVELPILNPPKRFLDLALTEETHDGRSWDPPASDKRRPLPWRVVDGRVRSLPSRAESTTTANGIVGPSQPAGTNITADPEQLDEQQDDDANAPDGGDARSHDDDDDDEDDDDDDDDDDGGNGNSAGVPVGVAHTQVEYEAMYMEELHVELVSRGEAEATLPSMRKPQRVARLVALDTGAHSATLSMCKDRRAKQVAIRPSMPSEI